MAPTTRTTSSYSSLDLTISVQGFSLSPPFQASSVMRDVDINQVPTTGGGDEEEEYCCMGMGMGMGMGMDDHQDYDDCTTTSGGNGPAARKKLRLTKEQSHLLEESFRHNHTLNTKQKEALAMELKLRPRQIEVWFQNRRARSKLKQTEMECEYLKRWFGSLTEQNRRLQREVDELRALKLVVAPPPPTVVNTAAAAAAAASSSLSMCPRCQRVSSTCSSLPDNKSSAPTPLSSYPSTSSP